MCTWVKVTHNYLDNDVSQDTERGRCRSCHSRTPIHSPSLPAATKLGHGNVFTGVCDSVNRGWCLPQCILGYTTPPWEQTPPPQLQTPPMETYPSGADTPPPKSTYPPEQTTPRSRPPRSRHTHLEQTHPSPRGADTPRSRHPAWSRHPPEQTLPWEWTHPQADTHPQEQTPPSPHTGSRLQHTVNERPVRILLECILVEIEFFL